MFYEKVHDLNFGWHCTCGAGRAFPLGLLSCGVDVQRGFSQISVLVEISFCFLGSFLGRKDHFR